MSVQGRPRIALVASSYSPHIGGVERHTAAVAHELRQRAYDVEVWSVDRGAASESVDEDGLKIRYLPTPLPAASPRAIVAFLRSAPSAWRAWRAAHREFRPEIIHIQCFGPNGVYADMLGRRTRTPRIVSSHGETQADDRNVFDRSVILRTALRAAVRTNLVTGCSQSVIDDLTLRFGARGGEVVRNGVDLEDLPDMTGVIRDPRRIVGVGRLERNKGFDLLLDAAALLPEDVSIELVGDGSEADNLRRQAESLGLGRRFAITGKLAHPEVLRRVAVAGVVCVPSRKESFGIVVLEGWAVGTPVVATAIAGPADFVTDGVDAVLVDPRDPIALADALGTALTPAFADQLVAAGRRSVQEFTWHKTADAYEGIFARILPHTSPEETSCSDL